jgi:multidrug resistance protein, MATE family
VRKEILVILKLGIPIVIAQLGVILMGVTDNIMVGRYLGAGPLGAAGLANSLAFLMSCIGIGGLNVISSVISQEHGQHDTHKIAHTFRTGLWVAVVLSIILCLLTALWGSYLELMKQPPEITAMARPFMLILSISNVPLLWFAATRQLSDGLSFTKIAMQITVGALITNVLLNYLLINGFWGFPTMGLNGSAMATLLSRCFMAIAIWIYITQNQSFKPYLVKTKIILSDIISLFRLVVTTGLQSFFEIAAFSLAVVMIGWLGKNQLAAHQIAINLAATTYMMCTGLAAAGAIRVGHFYGQNNHSGIRQAGNTTLLIVGTFMGFCCLLFLTANEFLVSFYLKNNDEVNKIAAELVIIAGFFQLSDGIQTAALGMLRGISDVKIPTFITFIAYWGLALPISYVLAFVVELDVTGVWIGLCVGLTFSAVFLTIRFYRMAKRIQSNQS